MTKGWSSEDTAVVCLLALCALWYGACNLSQIADDVETFVGETCKPVQAELEQDR